MVVPTSAVSPRIVLLVEDNPADAELLSETLAGSDAADEFTLTHLQWLGQAVTLLEHTEVDLILLDLSLPDSHGIETVLRLRRVASAVPIVVLTGTSDNALAQETLRAGAQDYLVKGEYNPGTLARTMRHAIERTRLAEALRSSEARYRSLVEGAQDVIFTLDHEGRIASLNHAFEAMTGRPASDSIGRMLTDLTDPADEVIVAGMLATAQTGRNTPPFEVRIGAANGADLVMDVTVTPLPLDGHRESAIGIARDVTDRVTAEQALQASEQRFRALVQHASDVILLLTLAGVVRYVSPSIERVLGHRVDETIGTEIFATVHPEDGERLRRGFAQMLHNPGAQPAVSFRCRHKDGAWREIEAVVTNLIDHPAIQGVVVNARDVTERRDLEAELRRRAFYDPLTDLPNRALYLDRLGHALAGLKRRSLGVGVLLLDLDGFKQVNDQLGHHAGDILLQRAGQRLLAAVRPSDTLARFGGDEFAVVLADMAQPADAAAAAERICNVFQQPFDIEGHEVVVTASAGVSFCPAGSSGAQPDAVLREADTALYQAKAAGKAGVVLFASGMRQLSGALTLARDLRRALAAGEFRVCYEVEAALDKHEVVALSARICWQYPQRALLLPEEFARAAEDVGVAAELDGWLLEQACREAAAWQQAGSHPPPAVSVNLSTSLLQRPNLPALVAATLARSGLPPHRLRIEVRQRAAPPDAAVSGALSAVKGLGVGVTLADFGGGYSSLTYLRALPVDAIKLDPTLVRGIAGDPVTQAIVRSVAALAAALHLDMTAAGVEVAADLDALRGLGCVRAQGLYVARVVPAEQIPIVCCL